MTKSLILLGATGSIGTQALDVARRLTIPVAAMAAGRDVKRFAPLCREFRPRLVAMADETAAAELKVLLSDLPVLVLAGEEGVCACAALLGEHTVLNAITGVAGLLPTMTAVEAGHDVALANKETLVAGGRLVMDAVHKAGVRLLPVDSEHSAIFQCLQGGKDGLCRLILTASGGPFFGKKAEELACVTRQDALRHPNWAMGAKITVDSATMMNKGLELIEARWLFDLPPERIDVVVHRESIVHSMVEYDDRSVIAQMGAPDMRVPIQYALTYPQRVASDVPRLDLCEAGKLTFYPPDDAVFPALSVCREALRQGGSAPAAVNGANEQAVALFLDDKIKFSEIVKLAALPLDKYWPAAHTIRDVLEADKEGRRLVWEQVKGNSKII